MVKGFRHACIAVGDLQKSLAFYRDALGLKVTKAVKVRGRYAQQVLGKKGMRLTYVKMRAPGQTRNSTPIFELHYWEKPRILPRPSHNHISFTVADIEGEYRRLRKAGVKFISKPVKTPYTNTKVCFARDPDKHLIEFVQEL